MIIPVNYAQINFKGGGTAYPRGWEVVVGVANDANMTAEALAGAAADIWEAAIPGVQSDQCTLTSVLAKLGPNATGQAFEVATSVSGTLTSQALPAQTAVLVTKLTIQGGRSGRGRMFWPGATEAQTDGGGTLTGTALAAWQTAMLVMHSALQDADLPMFLLHTDPTNLPDTVISLNTAQLMATQRRRLRRVGGRRTS